MQKKIDFKKLQYKKIQTKAISTNADKGMTPANFDFRIDAFIQKKHLNRSLRAQKNAVKMLTF